MAKKRGINIHFPIAGLDRKGAYRQQSPYTTPDALNVRPFATIEGRERGGSRPALGLAFGESLGSAIRMLKSMNIVADSDTLALWKDSFDAYSLASIWSQAVWNNKLPAVLGSLQSTVIYSGDSGVAVRDAMAIDTTETYRLEMYIVPYEGAHHGNYKIFARMDDTTPNISVDGLTAELKMHDALGTYSGEICVTVAGSDTIYSFTAGTNSTPTAGWFTVEIAANLIKCYWNRTEVLSQTIDAQTGKRFGFGMDCTQRDGACLVDVFQIQYIPVGAVVPSNSFLVASAGGDVYCEDFKDNMTVISSAVNVRDDVPLIGAQIGQKLYIGDYDTTDTRVIKVYDPAAGTLTELTASVGTLPKGNPCIARYRNRLVLAGEKSTPHIWYMARQNDPTDWDYNEEDAQAAVAGSSSDAGVPGEAVLAIIPFSDDYLIFGCENSLWIMRGDPATGGMLDVLNSTVGVVGSQAWTMGPNSELIFLSRDGIYVLPPGGSTYPISVSRQVLPQELINISSSLTDVIMEYDVRDKGCHIYLVPEDSNEGVHWWMDWERKTFWPVTLSGDHEPTAICRHVSSVLSDSGVILGGRDGYLRRYSHFHDTDCGESFESYVKLGPIPLGNDIFEGKLLELTSVLANNSGDVTWEVIPGDTYEGAVNGAVIASGVWTKEQNYSCRPGGRGMAFTLKLLGTGTQWAVEYIPATVQLAGKQRLL